MRTVRPCRGLIPLAGFSVLLILLTRALDVLDPGLVNLHDWKPGFWEQMRAQVWVALGFVWAAFGALALLRTLGPARWLVAALLAAALGVKLVLLHRPPGPDVGRQIRALEARADFDLAAYGTAAAALTRRVALAVPPHGRVAMIHDRGQPDAPIFLSFLLAPRIFFAFEGRLPAPGELRRRGIRWLLDVRGASYRSGYREVVLTRVQP